MSKSIKRILILLSLILAVLLPVSAFAAEKIDTSRRCDMTIEYKDFDTGLPLEGSVFSIYKLADIDEDTKLTLSTDFERYKAIIPDLNDINSISGARFTEIAGELKDLVAADGIRVEAADTTDATGHCRAEDLPVGLYLFIGTSTTIDEWTYTPIPTCVYLPNPVPLEDYDPYPTPVRFDPETVVWNYDVLALPKRYKERPPQEDEKECREVIKVWSDRGHESSRPAEITVQLFCDGTLYDTVKVTKAGNWKYLWDDLPAGHEWTVRETLNGYNVKIEAQTETQFVITNTYKPKPSYDDDDDDRPNRTPGHEEEEEIEDSQLGEEVFEEEEEIEESYAAKLPQTGVLWWPVPVLLAAGLLLILLGMIQRKRSY